MRAHIVRWDNIHEFGNLWPEYFALRKQEFVDNKGWDLPFSENAEWDCYDTPLAEFIIIEHDGHCIAGARLLPTDAPNYGPYTYMLKDAKEGRIKGIPKSLIPDNLPVSPDAFEATRFFVRRDIGMKTIIAAQRAIVQAACDRVRERGGSSLLALMPTKIYQLFRRFGFNVVELEKSSSIDDTPHAVGQILV